MRRTKYILVVGMLTLLNACTKESTTTVIDSDIPVVEAFLEPGQEVSVKLTRMFPFTENGYSGSLIIDSAEVYINYNGTDYLLTPEGDEPGRYINLNPDLEVVSGSSYNLIFDYNGYSVTAATTIPAKPVNASLSTGILWIDQTVMGPGSVQDPMVVSWDNPDNSYHLIIVEYMESSYSPINYILDSEDYDNFRKVSTEPILDNFYELDTRRYFLFFGTYKVFLYKINEEYVNLYENISQSSLNLTEPLSNINNGLGIFTGISSETQFLEVKNVY